MHVSGAERVFMADQHQATWDLARALLELIERAAPEIEHFGAHAAGGRGLRSEQRVAGERCIACGEHEPRFIESPARVARSLDARSARVDRGEPPLGEGKRCPLGAASRPAAPAIAEPEKIAPQRGIGGERAGQVAKRLLVMLFGGQMSGAPGTGGDDSFSLLSRRLP